jgi:hypothetical protein
MGLRVLEWKGYRLSVRDFGQPCTLGERRLSVRGMVECVSVRHLGGCVSVRHLGGV